MEEWKAPQSHRDGQYVAASCTSIAANATSRITSASRAGTPELISFSAILVVLQPVLRFRPENSIDIPQLVEYIMKHAGAVPVVESVYKASG